MLPILVFIIKLIGILLLVLLGTILLLLLSVLLVPVRYRGEGSLYGKKPEGYFKCSWFLHLVSVSLRYKEELEIRFCLLGIRLFKEKGRRAKEDLKEAVDNVADDALEEGETVLVQEADETPAGRAVFADEREETADSAPIRDPREEPEEELLLGAQELGGEDEPEPGVGNEWEEAREPEGKFKRRFFRLRARLCAAVKRVRAFIALLCRKGKQAGDIRQAALEFLADEENKKTLKLMKRQALKVMRHLRPKRLEGKITFGLSDPYAMGQILTAAAFFYPLYGSRLSLTPDFEQNILEGELKIRGRIRLGTLLAAGIRILLNKNFRRQLKKFLNRGGNEHGR